MGSIATRASPWVGSAISGLLMGLGIAGCPLSGLLTPISLALALRLPGRSPRIGAWLGRHATLGLFAAFGSGLWVPPTLVSLGTPVAAAGLAALGLALWHGALPFALVALLSHPTRSWPLGGRIAGYAAAVFVIETFVSRSGIFVPWVLLGHSQASWSPLAPLATLGGVPLISAVLSIPATLASTSVESTPRSRARQTTQAPGDRRRLAASLALGLLVFSVLARAAPALREHATTRTATSPRNAHASLRVLAIQPNLPTAGRWDPASQPMHANRIGAYSRQALDAIEPRPELLLWPENSVSWGRDSSDPRRLVADWAGRLDAALISGLAVPDASRRTGEYRNLLVWFGRDGRIVDSVDKEIAVPGLESAPPESWWSGPIRALLGRAAIGAKATTGADTRSLRADGSITQALCFEALFPGLVARRRGPATALLVNPSDDRWAGTPRASRQLARYASFRAIEQHLPLVRVAHAGLTVFYDAHGREVEALASDSFGALSFAVDRRAAPLRAARRTVAAAVLAGMLSALLPGRLPRASSQRPAPRRAAREAG